MNVLLVILAILAVAATAVYIATKYFKKFKDEDNNGIPDAVEERVERLKQESADVVDAVKEVATQAKGIVEAAKGKPRKGRRPQKTNKPKSSTPGGSSSASNTNYYGTNRPSDYYGSNRNSN